MERPPITKKLSLFAWTMASACFLLQLLVPFTGRPLLRLLMPDLDAVPGTGAMLGLVAAAAAWLPFAGVSLWHWSRPKMTANGTTAVLYLAPGMYLLSGLLRSVLPRILYKAFTVEQISIYSVLAALQGRLSIVMLAALVLVCCAASIELYLLTHSPADKSV